jgi:hypothetical protein
MPGNERMRAQFGELSGDGDLPGADEADTEAKGLLERWRERREGATAPR